MSTAQLQSIFRNPLLVPACLFILAITLFPLSSARADWENTNWSEIFSPQAYPDLMRSAPDGQGGMLVIMHDPGAPLFKISVQRLDRTGNERWGQGGMQLPFNVGSLGMHGPVDVVDDGAGGAYVIHGEDYTGDTIIKLARINAQGTLQWTRPVASFGPNPELQARLIKADGGDLFVVWPRSVGVHDEEVMALRVDADGNTIRETTVWEDSNNQSDYNRWCVESDGQGGLLFGIDDIPYVGPNAGRAMRMAGDGTLLWGNRGVEIYGTTLDVSAIVPDGSGGGYFMNTLGWGNTWAQHVDSGGTPSWAFGGIQPMGAGFSTWPYPSEPAFCSDGAGGFYMADGVTDMYAQRVEVSGNLLWGAGALAIGTRAGWQEDATITNDGFGGLLVVYRDHYFSELDDGRCRALTGIRLDAFGTTLWENPGFFWIYPQTLPGTEPFEPQVQADGSGGGLVAWKHYDADSGDYQIYAAGLDAAGNSPAVPVLTYISPDAGAVGDVVNATILGDYLDPDLHYGLAPTGGAVDATLGEVTAINGQLVSGTLDLGATLEGPHELRVWRYSTPLAVLPDAFGVGDPVGCEGDEEVPLGTGILAGPLGARRSAYLPDGDLVTAWIESNDAGYSVVWEHQHDGVGTLQELPASSGGPVRDLAFAVDPAGGLHTVWVVQSPGQDRLIHYYHAPGGSQASAALQPAGPVRRPAVACDTAEEVNIVYETDSGGQSQLMHVVAAWGGFGSPVAMGSGAGASHPDLSLDDGGLMLAFARDFWFPGLREMCYQRFTGGTWEAPVGVYFGLLVTSPSVAWDGDGRLLFSWVLDNTGADPLLHTMTMDNHTANPVRWRVGLPGLLDTSVAATGSGNFLLATREWEVPGAESIFLRQGDGEVFYPRQQLNSGAEVGTPTLAARPGLNRVAAAWIVSDGGGESQWRWQCSPGVSAVSLLPEAPAFLSAGPNPFNPTTRFRFEQRQAGWTRLVVYDVRGRLVRTLADGMRSAGAQEVPWDGRGDDGRALPSGVYFGRVWLPAGQGSSVVKVTMLK